MRKFLIKLIVNITNTITSRMASERKEDVFWGIANSLYSLNSLEIKTERGKIIFDASCRKAVITGGKDTLYSREPDTAEWIFSFPRNSCFWDIGSNIGIYGLMACLEPTVRVIGFEPAATNYAVLNKNIELNGVSDRFQAYCLALCESSSLDTLNLNNTEVGSWQQSFGGEHDQFDRRIEINFRQGAIGLSIDDFVEIFSPPFPTHIKIDVDGLEVGLLRGGAKTLSSPTLQSIIVEIEQAPGASRSSEIYGLLHNYGFIQQPKELSQYRNVIFERP